MLMHNRIVRICALAHTILAMKLGENLCIPRQYTPQSLLKSMPAYLVDTEPRVLPLVDVMAGVDEMIKPGNSGL